MTYTRAQRQGIAKVAFLFDLGAAMVFLSQGRLEASARPELLHLFMQHRGRLITPRRLMVSQALTPNKIYAIHAPLQSSTNVVRKSR